MNSLQRQAVHLQSLVLLWQQLRSTRRQISPMMANGNPGKGRNGKWNLKQRIWLSEVAPSASVAPTIFESREKRWPKVPSPYGAKFFGYPNKSYAINPV